MYCTSQRNRTVCSFQHLKSRSARLIFQSSDRKNVDGIAYPLIYTNFPDCSSQYALRIQQFHCYSECIYTYTHTHTHTHTHLYLYLDIKINKECKIWEFYLKLWKETMSTYINWVILSSFSSTVSKDQGDIFEIFFIYLDTLFSGIV
jgi:hypothetical protein